MIDLSRNDLTKKKRGKKNRNDIINKNKIKGRNSKKNILELSRHPKIITNHLLK